MTFRQMFSFFKKNKLISLLLAVFFVKQLLFVAILPIFQGPDEPAHYSTIQYKTESKKDIPPFITKKENLNKTDKKDNAMTSSFDFSEEILNTMELIETDKIAFHSSATQSFINSSSRGQFENEIKNSQWKKYIELSNPNIVAGFPGYYFIPSIIEKIFSKSDIFVRFFSIRIFSAFLGLLIVLLTYLSAKKIGFDEKISLLLTAIIAFQPMLSQASAIINYDIALVFTFALFTYGAIWAIKDNLNWKNGLIMFFAAYFGIITKAPAIVLWLALFILAAYFIKKYLNLGAKKFFLISISVIAIIFIISKFFLPTDYLGLLFSPFYESKFSSIFNSISEYLSTTHNRWDWSELSYWGNFGWLDTRIPSWSINFAHYIEIVSIFGIIAYFIFPRKIPEFLPKRKFVIFLIGIFLALELAIRFADWSYFNKNEAIEIGTPGRYFLPVIGAQFFLIAIGLGMLARKYFIWKNVLKVLTLGMILLWVYSVLIVIIPRYYL